MFRIDQFEFDDHTPSKVRGLRHDKVNVGVNWPTVYVINNKKEAYVGETLNVSRRIEQHLQSKERRKLTEIRIISDKNFNKSVVLDLEAFLIKYMASDGTFTLQNGNGGIQDHDYFERSQYKEEFRKIWNALKKKGVVRNTIDQIENSEMFKYSPYKSLGEEQLEVEQEILDLFARYSGEKEITILVRGGAGTGKTIMGIYLLKLLADLNDPTHIADPEPDEYYQTDDAMLLHALESISGLAKIAIVVPQKSLQTSLKDVFKKVKALKPSMVLSPAEVVKDYVKTGELFDLLLVDEAHRLKCRYKGHLSNYRIFDKCNRDLGLDKMEGTELDWIMKCSRHQILFRDDYQTVRPCDLDADDFMKILSTRYRDLEAQLYLTSQWRCQGGIDYIDYIRHIFDQTQTEPQEILNYDLKMYKDCAQMVADIKAKDRKYGLCRVTAGYAWPWDRKKPHEYTIEIQGHQYLWNRTFNNWITTKTAIDEIGCIHTVQGYDLNYAGVIIGEDLKLDPATGRIYADKTCYYDQQGKSGVADDPEGLKNYLINIYRILLTRGVRGTYVYVCDEELRGYLEKFLPVA